MSNKNNVIDIQPDGGAAKRVTAVDAANIIPPESGGLPINNVLALVDVNGDKVLAEKVVPSEGSSFISESVLRSKKSNTSGVLFTETTQDFPRPTIINDNSISIGELIAVFMSLNANQALIVDVPATVIPILSNSPTPTTFYIILNSTGVYTLENTIPTDRELPTKIAVGEFTEENGLIVTNLGVLLFSFYPMLSGTESIFRYNGRGATTDVATINPDGTFDRGTITLVQEGSGYDGPTRPLIKPNSRSYPAETTVPFVYVDTIVLGGYTSGTETQIIPYNIAWGTPIALNDWGLQLVLLLKNGTSLILTPQESFATSDDALEAATDFDFDIGGIPLSSMPYALYVVKNVNNFDPVNDAFVTPVPEAVKSQFGILTIKGSTPAELTEGGITASQDSVQVGLPNDLRTLDILSAQFTWQEEPNGVKRLLLTNPLPNTPSEGDMLVGGTASAWITDPTIKLKDQTLSNEVAGVPVSSIALGNDGTVTIATSPNATGGAPAVPALTVDAQGDVETFGYVKTLGNQLTPNVSLLVNRWVAGVQMSCILKDGIIPDDDEILIPNVTLDTDYNGRIQKGGVAPDVEVYPIDNVILPGESACYFKNDALWISGNSSYPTDFQGQQYFLFIQYFDITP